MIHTQTEKYVLRVGDSKSELKEYPENHFDSVVTDPPYELGFMGKSWDKSGIAFDVDFWKEVLRTLKPGGHLLAFSGTRTYHRMVCAIEDAGFQIRDQIQWLYGQGFPKSVNLGDGIGTALKPANEPIVLARKPLSEKTIADNLSKWGVGGINIDACRIQLKESGEDPRLGGKGTWKTDGMAKNVYEGGYKGIENGSSELGRFPANLILDEEAAKVLDQQTGTLEGCKPHYIKSTKEHGSEGWGTITQRQGDVVGYDDEGGASRFFYVAKASTRERNLGLDSRESKKVKDGRKTAIDNPFQRGETLRKNTHPTVKPVALMRYLVRLVTPKNGTILDPFIGSGPTGIASLLEDFHIHGIDLQTENVEISRDRMNNFKLYEDKKKKVSKKKISKLGKMLEGC